ncbi:uncharacterized protein PHACADRAFT_188922 [Phanerochaete carnosa HHB-10118-sp]|uniref:Uncharacterized protein n=1 Tax=Phanerochaete carnosa (strain HHB-10118-sp) TaxID=650164 RepID=K5WGM3_PHACS|nr:uncharacterized protein PHACADRAFT_188922 [Phanerochaete carnosa HHB-10118-sp]EKM49317.1 hypothetical protein PHACADRAFT_188922 [Phanerochaete carnosa HHB-10118-sp]
MSQVKPPTAYGGDDDAEEFERFISQLVDIMNMQNKCGEAYEWHCLTYFSYCPTGQAKKWFCEQVWRLYYVHRVLWMFREAARAMKSNQLFNNLTCAANCMHVKPSDYGIVCRFIRRLTLQIRKDLFRIHNVTAENLTLEHVYGIARWIKNNLKTNGIAICTSTSNHPAQQSTRAANNQSTLIPNTNTQEQSDRTYQPGSNSRRDSQQNRQPQASQNQLDNQHDFCPMHSMMVTPQNKQLSSRQDQQSRMNNSKGNLVDKSTPEAGPSNSQDTGELLHINKDRQLFCGKTQDEHGETDNYSVDRSHTKYTYSYNNWGQESEDEYFQPYILNDWVEDEDEFWASAIDISDSNAAITHTASDQYEPMDTCDPFAPYLELECLPTVVPEWVQLKAIANHKVD